MTVGDPGWAPAADQAAGNVLIDGPSVSRSWSRSFPLWAAMCRLARVPSRVRGFAGQGQTPLKPLSSSCWREVPAQRPRSEPVPTNRSCERRSTGVREGILSPIREGGNDDWTSTTPHGPQLCISPPPSAAWWSATSALLDDPQRLRPPSRARPPRSGHAVAASVRPRCRPLTGVDQAIQVRCWARCPACDRSEGPTPTSEGDQAKAGHTVEGTNLARRERQIVAATEPGDHRVAGPDRTSSARRDRWISPAAKSEARVRARPDRGE